MREKSDGGGRGNGDASPARDEAAPADVLRGVQAWMGIETGGAWEAGGDSDDGSSDEGDDLVLRR